MCDPATIMVTTALAGGLSAKAAYDQGQIAKQVGRNNQIMAEYAAQDAQRRGEQEAQAVQRRAAQVRGAQRAGFAARGLDLGVGTVADLQDQTDFFGEQDANTARFNASRDAWSSRVSGANARAQGNAAARQGNMQAFATVLGTGAQVADKWIDYKGK